MMYPADGTMINRSASDCSERNGYVKRIKSNFPYFFTKKYDRSGCNLRSSSGAPASAQDAKEILLCSLVTRRNPHGL